MIKRASLHGHWSSKTAFILAVTGSAVGLGNVWKFPYVAGENGGGAFVLVYLVCVFVIGLPIMMSEVMLGRRGRRNPISTMDTLGQEEAHNKHWRLLGLNGIVAGILILSFYSVIGGWCLSYLFYSADGLFLQANPEKVDTLFSNMLGDWKGLVFSYTVF
ncbi:MAG: sodium-dependent transporter, partial [Pseudomonadota bacterium]